MSKKRNRTKRQKAGGSTGAGSQGGGSPQSGSSRSGSPRGGSSGAGAPRSKKKRRISGASLAFIGLILFAAVAIALASMFGDRPDCPPGQVWSEAHGHCH